MTPGSYSVPSVAGLCWLTVGFVAVAPQVSALSGLTVLRGTAADEAPPPPSSRKARVQGASPTTKSNQPTHSLPQICSSLLPFPSFLCWLDFSLGHHEILVHVYYRADRLKGQNDCLNDWLTSSPCLDLCFFALIIVVEEFLLAQNDIP